MIVFADMSISNTKLIKNTAGYAGVIYINSQANTAIDNCEFIHNTATVRGGVLISHKSDIKIASSVFTNNAAYSGGVLHIQTNSVVDINKVVIKNNTAKQGVWYCIESTAIFSNDVYISDNLGSLFLHYSEAYFKGNTTFVNGKPVRPSETTSSFQEGGAITAFQSNIFFEGQSTLMYNSAISGGAIYATASKIFIQGNTTIVNNTATYSGGGIYLYQSEMNCKRQSILTLLSNGAAEKGGGIHAISSIIMAEYDIDIKQYSGSKIEVIDNRAGTAGGGICLEVNSKINILNVNKYDSSEAQYTLEFIANSAEFGGAVYVADDTNSGTCMSTSYRIHSTTTECFLQTLVTIILLRQETNLATFVVPNLINILFTGNLAYTSGSTVYGGLLDRCSMSPFIKRDNTTTRDEDMFDTVHGVTYFKSISNITDSDPLTISSHPVKVCFCRDKQPDCNYQPPLIQVKKGENFSVPLVAIDQVKNIISAIIYSSPRSNESGLGEGQLIQSASENCTDFIYSIFSPNDFEELHVYAEGPCKDAELSQGRIQIKFLPCTCPVGFQQNFVEKTRCVCMCDSKLKKYITNCDPEDETFTRKSTFWLTNINGSSNYLIYPYCPLDYCYPPSSNIRINLNIQNGADAQCTNNRSGTLCGTCKSGLSLSLGSSHCINCPSYWPAMLVVILLVAILAGVTLVFLLLFLNLTVAVGSLNGIIFYAHITNANRSTFLPFSKPNLITIFLAWLNLELGFDICLFKGMDSFWKTLLQLAYPVYLFLLVFTIIIISEHSTKFARFIGRKNPVATLATLILLSYSKLLHLTIASLSFAILNYPNGSHEVVWLPDASIAYIQGKHMILFLIAIFVLLAGGTYTAILFSWQWLLWHQDKKLLKWVRNQRLYIFLEPYHAPYTFKHRYWTGLLLFIRALLYIISAANVSSDPAVNLLAIVISVICLLLLKAYSQGSIYRKWCLDILEGACYINLALFALVELFILEGNRDQNVVAYISGSFTIALFLAVIVYHVFTELISKTRLWKYLQHKRKESEDLYMDSFADNNQKILVEPTYSEVAGPTHELLLPHSEKLE